MLREFPCGRLLETSDSKFRRKTMKGNKSMKTITNITYPAFALFAFVWFTLAPQARAVCQDACLTQLNTVQGNDALLNNTGFNNTAFGLEALKVNTTGSGNTASGSDALFRNITGEENTATGYTALIGNTTGSFNTATGAGALGNNTTGYRNTANGNLALFNNITGHGNTAEGFQALYHNTGSNNVGLGSQAGSHLTTGNGNVCIGAGILGLAGESNTTRIRNIYSSVATARAVYIGSDNKIGTLSSSRRYKEEIKPMEKASERLFALKPVTFRYKKEVDAERALSFGLIAEDVAEISPELITRDENGNPQTVRYDAVNAMLLNEFLKEHRKVQELEVNGAEQQREIKALIATVKEQAAQIQKVSAQLQLRKPEPDAVVNNP
jgi:hypothetical protein